MSSNERPVVLVTGGGSGIGRATARLLAAEGWQVVVTGRTEGTLREVANEHEHIGYTVSDISTEDAASSVSFTADTYGRLDALVNCAGMMTAVPTDRADFAVITKMFALNVIGPSRLVAAAIPHLAKSRGSIVNVTSAVAQLPSPRESFYGASKAALDFLTRAWAGELADKGIRVNAVAPGPTDSGLTERSMQVSAEEMARLRKLVADFLPAGRVGEPEDIAPWIHRLIDPKSAFVTGQTFTIDGGMTIVSAIQGA
jgi:NAD(P)-dependent dehydrogenase (short-subunit alcohol dehydrogenase family)